MSREQAMEWILPALYAVDAPSHPPQPTLGPSSSEQSVGAFAVEKTGHMAAQMGRHAPADPNAMKLSDEQQYVVDLVKQGYNVFFTGSAGVPRSYFIFLSLCVTRRRHGQVGLLTGDHPCSSSTWSARRVCHRQYRHCSGEYRRVHHPLVCWRWACAGGCRYTVEEGEYGSEREMAQGPGVGYR
jgi:hypothetical protein